MFVGRHVELKTLQGAYDSNKFEMVIIYGRRRVGKTTLLTHFAADKPTLFFTAQQQSAQNNLSDFSAVLAKHFDLPADIAFTSWKSALEFVAEKARNVPLLFIFDEFPYAAISDPSLTSVLQIAIDHFLSDTKLCLVLCGSDQGFMESDVLGKKSPLHGRRTVQIRLKPFDYLTAASMLPGVSDEDAFKYYACIGGVPYYLEQINTTASFRENIARLYFDPSGFLYEEPLMLLRQELREPSIYNSILRAIGSGANRQNEIADRAGITTSAAAKYLKTLQRLHIIERIVPFGESLERSRKGVYRFRDGCYDFWYSFVMPVVGDIEEGMGRIVARNIPEDMFSTYLGRRFERVCLEWLRQQSLNGDLSIQASGFGSWWGTDSTARQPIDIDIVAADRFSKTMIVGECKWRNEFDESEALSKLKDRAHCIKDFMPVQYWLFSKNPLSSMTLEKMKSAGNEQSVTMEELYQDR